MPWLPESPRYLIQVGKHQEARKVLGRLHEAEEAVVEFAQIETQIEIDKSLPSSWASLIQKRSYRIRALYAVGLACGIQFVSILLSSVNVRTLTWCLHRLASWSSTVCLEAKRGRMRC
jgi:hypothetical protein